MDSTIAERETMKTCSHRACLALGLILWAFEGIPAEVAPPASGHGEVSPEEAEAAPKEPLALAGLLQGVSDRRPVEGRLSGFDWAAWKGKQSAPASAKPEELVSLAQAIARTQEAVAVHPESARAHQALGLARLVQRNWDGAISELEQATLSAPESAPDLADLAGAYLGRGSDPQNPTDDVLALEAALRSLEIDPRSATAAFNKAVALTRLGLPRRARAAWELYLSVDAESDWAREARSRYEALIQAAGASRFEAIEADLETAALHRDEGSITRISGEFPTTTRRFLEERLLPRWASAMEQGARQDAARSLQEASIIASTLSRLTGDRYASDAVEAVERVSGKPERQPAAVRGHLLFSQADEIYHRPDCQGAEPRFQAAHEALKSIGSPFALQARLYLASCESYADPAHAGALLDELASDLAEKPYPYLRSRVEWVAGLAAYNRGELGKAAARYRRGLELVEGTGDPFAIAGFRLLLAAANDGLGKSREAWKDRRLALPILTASGDPRQSHNALYDLTTALLRAGHSLPALESAAEMVQNATEWGIDGAAVEALYIRAQVRSALGYRDAAAADFAEASERLRGLPSKDPVRKRLSADLEIEEGASLAASDPKAAIEYLSTSLESFQEAQFLEKLPRLSLLRARARSRLGDVDGAEADLEAAVAQIEVRRVEPADPGLRMAYFETVQDTYDEMVRLQAEKQRDAGRALLYADRSRARGLLDAVQPGERTRFASQMEGVPGLRPPDSSVAPDLLPPEVVLVEYEVLPERLLIWVVRRNAPTVFADLLVTAEALEASVRQLRALLERNAPLQVARPVAARLYDDLIRPVAASLPPEAPIVFVPDKGLVRLPFAALFDAQRERFVVEDHAVSISPSAAILFAMTARSEDRSPAETPGVLVVGDPAFDRQRFPDLPALPGSATEARSVASLWPRSTLLLGHEATRDKVLYELGRNRIAHLATHALFNPARPELSGLVLAADGEGKAVLSAKDIAALGSVPEIVVLSTCTTLGGLPGDPREGLAGVATSFLAAGVHAVVGTLWEVTDGSATTFAAELQRLLAEGRPLAAALRELQVRRLHSSQGQKESAFAWTSLGMGWSR